MSKFYETLARKRGVFFRPYGNDRPNRLLNNTIILKDSNLSTLRILKNSSHIPNAHSLSFRFEQFCVNFPLNQSLQHVSKYRIGKKKYTFLFFFVWSIICFHSKLTSHKSNVLKREVLRMEYVNINSSIKKKQQWKVARSL